jgi:hypothetical protein
MKNIANLFLVATALSLGFSSCSDFLDEDNKTGETADLAYETVSGIQGLVNSCYSFSRGWWGKEAGLGLSEMGTDEFYYGYDNKQKSLNGYNLTAKSLDGNTADDACLDHYWELFYCAVDVCNNAIYYIPRNTIISETTRDSYLGEAYFLRALYYSQMVAIWGPIPYNTDPTSTVSTNPVREPEEVVISGILSDLDKSMEYFKAGNVMSKSKASSEGHATYYAAQALKARVLLFAASWLGANSIKTNEDYAGQNLYTLAQAAAQDVIDNAGASFYERYADTWTLANEAIADNKEAIWGVSYENTLSTANCIPYRYKTNSSGTQQSYNSLITRTGYTRGGSAMNLMFVSMWNNGANDLGGNGAKNTCVFVRVLGSSTASIPSAKTGDNINVEKFYSPYGRGFTRYLPTVYLWKLLDSHRATDQRFEGTLLTHYNMVDGLQGNAKNYPLMGQNVTDADVAYAQDGNYFNAGDTAIYYSPLNGDSEEGKALQAYAKDRYRVQFLAGGDIPVYSSDDPATALPTEAAKEVSDIYGDNRFNSYKIAGWCSYPGIKKFLDDVYNSTYPTHDITYRDAIVFRLSEMYLIKAECQLANGSQNDARSTINVLRQARAISGTDNSLTGTVDVDVILDERAMELCGEQQRWFDLKRTHKLLERVKKYNAQASGNIKEYHYYRPIPEAQMEGVTNVNDYTPSVNNGVLDYSEAQAGFWQNPGY